MPTIPESPLVLVDGSAFLFRAYYALPPLTTSKGDPSGAIFGTIKMLKKLIEDFQPSLMAVIFDTKGPTFRHEMYDAYKANRTVMPEELSLQIPPLHNAIKAMGLPLILVPGVEADDVIGTLAKKASEKNIFTLIASSDKDLMQLVNDQVYMIDCMKSKVYDKDAVQEKMQVTPELIIDYLAMVGDTVDNIPGIPKVGPKTAVKWLDEYGSLDGVIDNAEKIKGKVGENLRGSLQNLELYRTLTTVKLDVELAEQVSDLGIQEPNIQELSSIYKHYEFKGLLAELNVPSTTSAHQDSSLVEIIYQESHLNDWLKLIEGEQLFAIDTETTSLNYMQARLVGISLAVTAKRAYIPLAHDYDEVPGQLDTQLVLDKLKPILQNSSITKVAHNFKYDLHVLANYGIEVIGNLQDTMLQSYVLSSTGRHNLDALAEKYLSYTTIKYQDVTGSGAKQIPFSQVVVKNAAVYSAEDSAIALELYDIFKAKLAQNPELLKVYQEIEMPLMMVLHSMERSGVLINANELAIQSKQLATELMQLEESAYKLAGEEFNMNSPKQLQEILFDKLELPILQKTPKGKPSTNESVLQDLAVNYDLPAVIIRYRSLSKLMSTYTDSLPENINPNTGRIHTWYHQAVTSTGRLSSSEPNLQNIPIKTPEGRKVRDAFIAEPQNLIMSLDYSQIELRIMAHLSADPGLLQAFADDLDIHKITAAEVFEVAVDEVSDVQRRHAKAVNFGLMYGMSAFGLSKQLAISREQAQDYIKLYFAKFPKVQDFMNHAKQYVKEYGYVATMFGRRLYLPDINSKNAILVKAAERAAINAPMQGGQADIIKLAMIEINKYLLDKQHLCKMLMQVHDELVFEVVKDQAEKLSQEIKKIMQEVVSLKVPLLVDVGYGSNWGQAH